MAKTDYFSYTDANGTEVIVQRLSEVPEQYRPQAKHIDLSKPAITLQQPRSDPADSRVTTLSAHGQSTSLHWPSVAAGAGVAFVLGIVAALALRRASRLLWLLIGVAAIAALSTAYLGYIRQQAGLSRSRFAGPGALIDDAKRAAAAANSNREAQERMLQEIDRR